MVMLEAMATGTPVVALRRGAVPELVRSGVTGLVCADADGLPTALRATDRLDPAACVAHVARNFSTQGLAAGYEAVYRRLTTDATGPARPRTVALAGAPVRRVREPRPGPRPRRERCRTVVDRALTEANATFARSRATRAATSPPPPRAASVRLRSSLRRSRPTSARMPPSCRPAPLSPSTRFADTTSVSPVAGTGVTGGGGEAARGRVVVAGGPAVAVAGGTGVVIGAVGAVVGRASPRCGSSRGPPERSAAPVTAPRIRTPLESRVAVGPVPPAPRAPRLLGGWAARVLGRPAACRWAPGHRLRRGPPAGVDGLAWGAPTGPWCRSAGLRRLRVGGATGRAARATWRASAGRPGAGQTAPSDLRRPPPAGPAPISPGRAP